MKELEDFVWFPAMLRNFQTEYIGFAVVLLGVYDVFAIHLGKERQRSLTMTDLCSGSGQPAVSIFRKSQAFRRLVLSDKYAPGRHLKDENIVYDNRCRDVLTTEFKPGNCYTMFNSFHHFEDAEKRSIVQQLHLSGSGAFVVELLEPTLLCLLKVMLATTVGVLLLTPFIAPFSWARLFFTYLLPVNVLTITFDGIVSVLKSRSAGQYQTLFADCPGVSVFTLKSQFVSLTVVQMVIEK